MSQSDVKCGLGVPVALAPKVVVWGDAKAAARPSSPVTAQAPQPTPAAVVAPPSVTKKFEEAPPVLPSSAPKAILEPMLPQPVGNVPRRGLLRRFASGVRSLNPIRKESAIVEKP